MLSTKELQGAERFWLKETQCAAFSIELNLLQRGKPLPRSSKLSLYRPFINGEGLLRVGGTIEMSKLSYVKRHPVLLPRDHKVVDLLITYGHLRLLHGGPTLVAASLAQRFCIIRGRRTIRTKIRKCVTCRRIGARVKPQMLGQLPKERINPQDVFDNTGVDYAGPIYQNRIHTQAHHYEGIRGSLCTIFSEGRTPPTVYRAYNLSLHSHVAQVHRTQRNAHDYLER